MEKCIFKDGSFGKIQDVETSIKVLDGYIAKKIRDIFTGAENLNFSKSIVLETKLSSGTALTTPQTSALLKVRTSSNTFTIRSILNESTTNSAYKIGSGTSNNSLKIRDYIKVYSDGGGALIQDIISLK